MCGIAAAFAYRNGQLSSPELSQLEATCSRMQCRGPDGFGLWRSSDDRVAIGHRRLAIIDLSDRSAQPMRDPLRGSVIAFNGEIYNYRELRRRLEAKGYQFRSDGDTEVLLHLYADMGPRMLSELRGMFAFAIWDEERQGLFLARDPLGIKPLYYADTGKCLFAASEVKALRQFSAVDTAPEPAGHVGFFVWGHVPEPYTLFCGIKALPAGSTLWVDSRGTELKSYADVSELLSLANSETSTRSEVDPRAAEAELRSALLDTVRHHLIADVEVGVFLSSGLDSTTIAALAAEAGGQLRTVTLGFAEYRGTALDETGIAEEVAARYGARHTTVWITREEFRRELPYLVERMDQPSIDGVNTFFVARAAHQLGLKVALSGLGGDELFGGYSSFSELPRLVSAMRRVPGLARFGRGFRVVSAPLLRRITSPKYAGLLEYGSDYGGAYLLRRGLFLPWELGSVIDGDLATEGWRKLQLLERLDQSVSALSLGRLKVSALEASWYMRNQLLRDTDWASMSHSLEVRVPLVDWTLWARVSELLKHSPSLDKQAMARAARPELPDAVLRRKKTGFMVPVREWMLHNESARFSGRGLRGWAQYVYQAA